MSGKVSRKVADARVRAADLRMDPQGFKREWLEVVSNLVAATAV